MYFIKLCYLSALLFTQKKLYVREINKSKAKKLKEERNERKEGGKRLQDRK